jgi:hypothetical protein
MRKRKRAMILRNGKKRRCGPSSCGILVVQRSIQLRCTMAEDEMAEGKW